jgi:hypothetical protein
MYIVEKVQNKKNRNVTIPIFFVFISYAFLQQPSSFS